MCDIDCGSDEGFDVGIDSDISGENDCALDMDITDDGSYFESLDDVADSVEECSEEMDLLSDVDAEYSGEYPSLAEYSDLIDETDDVEELSSIKAALYSGEFSEDGVEGESFDVCGIEDADEDFVLLEDVEPGLIFTQEELQELSEIPEVGSKLEELVESGRIASVETDELEESGEDNGDVKVLTREITPEIIENRERDTEEVLDNYRENLRDRGVSDEQIDEFLDQERDKINAEYESLDQGNLSDNIYYEPTDWDETAEILMEQDEGEQEAPETITDVVEVDESSENLLIDEEEEIFDEMPDDNLLISEFSDIPVDVEERVEAEDWLEETQDSDFEDIVPIEETLGTVEELEDVEASEKVEGIAVNYGDELENSEEMLESFAEEIISETPEFDINYEDIYEEIQQESLEQGFENVDIYENLERLDNSLENFEPVNWENLSLEGQKESISTLAEYVEGVIGFENPPRIEYYNNQREGDYGGYDARTNTLSINEYMLYNSDEAADTIAHELWHAHQRECAENPQSARDYQYQYNFENYIRPEMGHEAYENQLIEAEARAFAAQFKGHLAELKGRSR